MPRTRDGLPGERCHQLWPRSTAGSRSGEQAPEQKGAIPSLPSLDAVSSPGSWDLTSSSLLNPQLLDSQLTAQQPAIDGPSEEKVFQ